MTNLERKITDCNVSHSGYTSILIEGTIIGRGDAYVTVKFRIKLHGLHRSGEF